MKRKNSKFIISSLFVGVFASSALLGVLKGIDFSNEANIYIHGQKNKIEDVYKLNFDNLIPHDISLYEESTDGSETGEGGDGSEGGETTTPPTSSKKESQAEWAQIAFMTAALSGTYGFEGDKYEGNTDIIYDDTILFSENQDWNQTDIVKFISYPKDFTDETTKEQQKFAKLYNYSSGIKFYTETTGNTVEKKSIDRYIKDLAAPDTNPSSEMLDVQRHMVEYSKNNKVMEFGWDDLKTIAEKESLTVDEETTSGKEILKKDFGIIINTKDYRMEVTSFLYTYAYLWQDSNSTVYDYKLTEELVALRPSFVWQQDVVSSSTTTAIDPNAFDTAIEGQIPEDEIGTTANSDWNNWYVNNVNSNPSGLVGEWDITYDDYAQLPNGLVGYRGIQTQNNSALGSVDSQFWNYKNEFSYEDDITTIKDDSQLAVAKTGDAMLYNQFDEVEGTGSYLITGAADEEGNSSSYTLAHSIITPYVFANGYNEETGLANKWEYSLYGNVNDRTNVVSKIDEAGVDESIETSIFNNYTPLIVGASDDAETFAAIGEKLNKERKYTITALYIIYSIYNAESSGEEATSNPLLNNAYKYWNDQGFYIELTGSYYDDYSELLPKLIQKDYGKK